MRSRVVFSSASQEWETPPDLYNRLDAEFCFTLDPCCTVETAKCNKFYTKRQDGLSKDWKGENVFCNPPYGKGLPQWVKKCYEESKKENTKVVMLIPARTDTRYFHDFIYQKAKEIRFIKGRLKFSNAKCSAPFPSMIIIF